MYLVDDILEPEEEKSFGIPDQADEDNDMPFSFNSLSLIAEQ